MTTFQRLLRELELEHEREVASLKAAFQAVPRSRVGSFLEAPSSASQRASLVEANGYQRKSFLEGEPSAGTRKEESDLGEVRRKSSFASDAANDVVPASFTCNALLPQFSGDVNGGAQDNQISHHVDFVTTVDVMDSLNSNGCGNEHDSDCQSNGLQSEPGDDNTDAKGVSSARRRSSPAALLAKPQSCLHSCPKEECRRTSAAVLMSSTAVLVAVDEQPSVEEQPFRPLNCVGPSAPLPLDEPPPLPGDLSGTFPLSDYCSAPLSATYPPPARSSKRRSTFDSAGHLKEKHPAAAKKKLERLSLSYSQERSSQMSMENRFPQNLDQGSDGQRFHMTLDRMPIQEDMPIQEECSYSVPVASMVSQQPAPAPFRPSKVTIRNSGVYKRAGSANSMGSAAATRKSLFQDGSMTELEMHPDWQGRLDEIDEAGFPPFDPGLTVRGLTKDLGGYNKLRSFGRSRSHLTVTQPCSCVSSPDSGKRLTWDIMGILLLSYDLVTIPLLVFDIEDNLFFFSMRIFSCMFWTMDIAASFLVGFHHKGMIEMDPWRISKHYLTSWFIIDVGLVFIDLFLFITISQSEERTDSDNRSMKFSRFFRILRLLRLMKFVVLLSDISFRFRSDQTRTLIAIGRLICFIIAMNHFIACGFYGLHLAASQYGGKTWVKVSFDEGHDVWYRYATAMHWSLTQFTPASMEVVPANTIERFYTVIVLLFALVTFSSFVSSITAAMTALRNINARKLEEDSMLRRYLSDHGISVQLTCRVLHYFQERAQQNKYRQVRTMEQDVLLFQVLPESTKLELRVEAYMPVVTLHPAFMELRDLDERATADVCKKCFSEKHLVLHDELYGHGKPAKEMVYVVIGMLAYRYTINNFKATDHIQKNEWCCEMALWANRSEGVRPFVAEANCELVLLNAEQLSKTLSRYPAASAAIALYAARYVEEANRQSSGNIEQIPVVIDSEMCGELASKTFDEVDKYLNEQIPGYQTLRGSKPRRASKHEMKAIGGVVNEAGSNLMSAIRRWLPLNARDAHETTAVTPKA